MITGATAEIALEHARKIRQVPFIQAGRCHDHASRAEAALESGSFHEGLLHRMQFPVLRKAFDRGHLASVGAKSRD